MGFDTKCIDIGGGSVPNDTPNSLARIPLRWMIRQCFLVKTGIQFEAEKLRDIGLEPETLYPRVIQRPHPDIDVPKDTQQDKKGSNDTSATVKIAAETNTQPATGTTNKRLSWLSAPKMGKHWRKSSGASTLVEGRRPSTSDSGDAKL